jgi:lipid A ethanolaminephosphotransferase
MPDCPRSDIQNCSAEEIVNTYDNTILFTDFIIAEAIKKLKAQEGDINPSLLYVSDHGESLGENGIYLHGMPYGIAPDEQTKVPLIFWTTNTVAKAKGINLGCLRQKALTGTFSHDNIAHSLLGYMGVTTSLYKPDLDIFSTCKL